jgi:Icc protein
MLAVLVRHGLHVERVLSIGAWFIHLLPTSLAGREVGRAQAAELEALDATLRANRDKHALICLHHHPVPVGGPWGADAGIENPDELFQVTDGHANVRGLLWGHVHKGFESERAGVRLLASPSTSFDVVPDAKGFPSVGPAKPGYRRLALHEDGTIESEVRWVAL